MTTAPVEQGRWHLLEEAVSLLRKVSEDNERRAADAGALAASRAPQQAEAILREVHTRRVLVAFGLIAADAVSVLGEALRGHAPGITEEDAS